MPSITPPIARVSNMSAPRLNLINSFTAQTIRANQLQFSLGHSGIIDDIVDSGETMKEILFILKEKFPNIEFKIATLFYKNTALIKPDFSVREANEWIDFFWEVDVK